MNFDPKLDLQMQRNVPVPPADIWGAWTTPDLLMQWFCPRPWKVIDCEIDLRPGGVFKTVMQSPEGQNMPAEEGTYLLVEPEKRLVWTNMIGSGFRPKPKPLDEQFGFFIVVDLRLEPLPNNSTHYCATVMHQDEAARQAHEAMGFDQGWGIALDQLVALMRPGN